MKRSEPEHRRPQVEKHKATRIKNPSGAKQPKGVKKEKILTDKAVCQSQDLLFTGLFTIIEKGKKNGTPGGIRTHDLLLRRQTLYPAELRVHAYRVSI